MRILADRNMAGVADVFSSLGEVELFDGRALQAEQVVGADILLVRSVTPVDLELLGDARPAFVGTATSGFDHVNRDWLAEQDIPFAHAPGSNADSVVDYVLSVLCRYPEQLQQLFAGEPLGIIGYGNIGKRLHQRLERLGIRCLAYDPWLSDLPALSTLDAVLACPVLCLHAALTREAPWPSVHMLDADLLSTLPRDALLVNAGRGELLATEALLALNAQRPDVRLVLDVWEREPHPNPDLLSVCDIGTAHIAGYSYDGKLRATRMLYEAACLALGQEPDPAAGKLPPVDLEAPVDLSADALIDYLVLQVYDVQEDDVALRAAMPDGFDDLRKQYRKRRELSSLRVTNAAVLDPAALATCGALGVQTC